MAENIGQVAEDVDNLAAEFETRAGDLETLQTTITGKLNGTTWTGPDRDRFQADWEGQLSQTLTQMIQQLRAAGQLAGQNAQEQRDASGS
ncbi:MAG: WXG100 family type VII secretion target [Glaciihabitans sp.]